LLLSLNARRWLIASIADNEIGKEVADAIDLAQQLLGQGTITVFDVAAVTLGDTDAIVLLSAPATLVTLPPAADHVGRLHLKDMSGVASSQPHQIAPDGVETIDGQTGLRLLQSDYGAYTLLAIDAGWVIL